MEEDKFGYHWEEEVRQAIQKYERMRRNNEKYFFDVIEFESIIDYYIDNNNSVKAFEAAILALSSIRIQCQFNLESQVLLDKGRLLNFLKILRVENIEHNHEIYYSKGTALGMLGDIQGAKNV